MLRLLCALILLVPLMMGASMCDSSKKTEEKVEALEEEHNPMKKIPRDYQKTIDAREKNLEKSLGYSLGEDGAAEDDNAKGTWKGPKKWKGPK